MKYNFSIQTLGKASIASPIVLSKIYGDKIANYVSDADKIRYSICLSEAESEDLLEQAGPRAEIFFDPKKVRAGIITCGGLCPGLNDVIRSIVNTLWHNYCIEDIYGIKYGYNGFLASALQGCSAGKGALAGSAGARAPKDGSLVDSLGIDGEPYRKLNPEIVRDIHRVGGSILGSSRGGGNRKEDIVNAIEKLGLNMLFTIGGDGTQKGALGIVEEISKRGLEIAVVGIPKTIDNDLSFIERSFGFETAVTRATEVVFAAHQEANSAIHGIGLVKLMGRESGFIAAYTAIASQETNYVLIPEVPFRLEGKNGLLENLRSRLEKRNHAVIVVAEGAGQELLNEANEQDASGNTKLGDIGLYLKDRITAHFKAQNFPINLKYIDPSYIIRSSAAIPTDSLYCARLGSNAVHAAIAGKTGMLVSLLNGRFVHVPMALSAGTRNFVDPESSLWRDVLEATGMPLHWG